MAQRLAALLLRPVRSSSNLIVSPSFPSSSSTATIPTAPVDEAFFLKDGTAPSDLQALLSPDLSTSLRYLLHVLQPSNPKLAVRIATYLLNPTPRASSTTASSPRPTRSKTEFSRAVVALLLGIDLLLRSRPHLEKEDEESLEQLSEMLVGVFVKGGVRPPTACGGALDLDKEVVCAFLGTASKGVSLKCGSKSIWELSRVVVVRLEKRIVDLQQEEDEDEEEARRRTRIRITTTYLLALLNAPSTTRKPTTASLSPSEILFKQCIHLGLEIDLLGASQTAVASLDPHDSHASSLVWKSRKRLELSGHATLAVFGLPSNGGAYERWDGGAGERARVAEDQVRRAKILAGEERAVRSTRSLSRLAEDGGEGGDLLAAPRRLKGKKIVDQRRGTYSPPSGRSDSSVSSSSGPSTPQDSFAVLQFVDCNFPHHFHGGTSSPTIPGSSNRSTRSHSTTSLPALFRKTSLHLLQTVSPIQFNSTLPRDHRKDTPSVSPDSLKSSIPIPLPNIFDSQGIFSPTHAAIELPLSPAPTAVVESVFYKGTKTLGRLRHSISRLALSFIGGSSAPPPLPSSSSPSTPADSLRGRPACVRVAFGSTAGPTSPPSTPILISEVPKISFQPSSFTYQCFDGGRNASGGIWRPGSPRGVRTLAVGGGGKKREEA